MKKTDMRKSPAALIVNTKSRRGERYFPLIRQKLRQQGFNLQWVEPVSRPAAMADTVRRALDSGAGLIILGSGDGTVSEVIDLLAYHHAVLGYVPLGTTNNFARSSQIPLDTEQALDNLITGKVTRLDLARVNGDYFANVCSMGLSAYIAQHVAHWQKKWFGRFAYTFTGLRALTRQRAFEAVLSDESGKERRITTWQLIVANGRSHAGRPLTDYAHIADGKLTVFAALGRSRWRLIKTAAVAARSRDHPLAELTHFEARRLRVTADIEQPIEIDGEIKTTTPADIAVTPRALKVIVPREFS